MYICHGEDYVGEVQEINDSGHESLKDIRYEM